MVDIVTLVVNIFVDIVAVLFYTVIDGFVLMVDTPVIADPPSILLPI